MMVLITEFMDANAVATLRARYPTHYDETLVDRRAEMLQRAKAARSLIVRNRTRVDSELLDAAPLLKVIGRLGVGLDNIDTAACRVRGIEVIPAAGANALAVAEYVVTCALLLLRGAFLSSGEVASGKWPRAALSDGRESAGKTLGLVGFGSIGQVVAGLCRGLGMVVIAHDPGLSPEAPAWGNVGARPVSFEALLAESDALSLHVPLTDATRNLIDARRIEQMKPGAVLINTARGAIVDEAALAAALRSGRLGGAAIDVFAREPLAEGSPLAGSPNLVLTPHIAGVSRESNVRVSSLIAERVSDALARFGA